MFEQKDILISTDVAISTGNEGYPSELPYAPATSYPEYPFGPETLARESNPAYEGVRYVLRLLKLGGLYPNLRGYNP